MDDQIAKSKEPGQEKISVAEKALYLSNSTEATRHISFVRFISFIINFAPQFLESRMLKRLTRSLTLMPNYSVCYLTLLTLKRLGQLKGIVKLSPDFIGKPNPFTWPVRDYSVLDILAREDII